MTTIFVAIFLTILGLVSLFVGVKFYRSNNVYKNWSRAESTIVNKVVGEKKILPGTDLDNFRVYITYEFEVLSKKYVGTHLNAIELLKGEQATLKRMANKQLKQIPDKVTIFYNPDNPNESFIYLIPQTIIFICLFFGATFTLGGIIAVYSCMSF